MPIPWSMTAHTTSSPSGRTLTRTSPPSGLNLIALWTRLTNTWPSRASSPRTIGTPGSIVDDERDGVAVGEQAEPLDRALREAAEVDVVAQHELAAALDAREIQQLADHLDEVAGLDLDLDDPLPHPGRHVGALRVAGERLGEEADGAERRAELVAEVVDELRADLLEAAQLGDVLEHDEAARRRPVDGR